MKDKNIYEKLAVTVSVSIIVGWAIFWIVQVIGVIEMLELAYS